MRLRADADAAPTLVAQITIKVLSDGALCVEGPTHDLPWMLAALAHATQSVKDHHSTRPIILPGSGSSLDAPSSTVAPLTAYRRSA